MQNAVRGGIPAPQRPLREKRRDEAADRRRGVLERMFGIEAPRAGKSGMFLRTLPRRKRTRRGRRCEILQNSYRQPDSRHAEKYGEEMTARQDMLLSATVGSSLHAVLRNGLFLPFPPLRERICREDPVQRIGHLLNPYGRCFPRVFVAGHPQRPPRSVRCR